MEKEYYTLTELTERWDFCLHDACIWQKIISVGFGLICQRVMLYVFEKKVTTV